MSYCASDDVRGEFKDLPVADSGTVITTAKMTRFLAEADAGINARLSLKYVTPITGTEALIVVRQIAIYKVAHRISRILQVKTATEKQSQDSTGKNMDQMADDMLTKLVEGKMKLTDATLASAADGVKDYNSENGVEHVFKKGCTQW